MDFEDIEKNDNDDDVESKNHNNSIEKGRLITDLQNGVTITLMQKVANVLAEDVKARNSDIALQKTFWNKYENDIFNGHSVTVEDLYNLTKLTSLVRARAKFRMNSNCFLHTLKFETVVELFLILKKKMRLKINQITI